MQLSPKLNNIIRTVSLLAAGAGELLVKVAGCDPASATAEVADALKTTCDAAWLTPGMAHYVTIGAIGVNLLLKATRPGGWISGWFGQTAVVVPADKNVVGTVTKSDVAAT